MPGFTESNITLNFPDANFFVFATCEGYTALSGNHFKESLRSKKYAKIKSRLLSSSAAMTILLKGLAIEHEEPYEG